MVLPTGSKALTAVFKLLIVITVPYSLIVQYFIAQIIVELLHHKRPFHIWHFRPQFSLRSLLLLIIFTYATAPNPNIQEGVTDLPQVKIWDGLPYHEFRAEWYQTLKNALGSVAQDGWTLLQTALNLDIDSRAGSVAG